MDFRSLAATEANNIGQRAEADEVAVRMAHREVRFPRRSSLLLGALPSAVPCARLHARQVLWEWGLSESAETAELLLSELVTNAVRAARAIGSDLPVNIRLSANRDRLLIEIWDGNVQPPVLRVVDDEHGGVIGREHVLAVKSPVRRSRAGLGVQGVAGMVSLSR